MKWKDRKGGVVVIVVGGQLGSESKGNAVVQLTKELQVDYAVRTGSINAGHTCFYNGSFHAMQQIPVSWIDPSTRLVIGRGAYVDPELLKKEIALIDAEQPKIGTKQRLIVDPDAGTQLPKHEHLEQEAGLHGRMGSTGHGCMESQIDRMRRKEDYMTIGRYAKEVEPHIEDRLTWGKTDEMLNDAYDLGQTILLEGTQGTHLDFLHGDHPFVTTRPTCAAHWMTEAGLSPNLDTTIYSVCRTYPIRVAGNSGPMGQELSWPDLVRRVRARLKDIAYEGPEWLPSEVEIEEFENAEVMAMTELDLPVRPHLIVGEDRLKHAQALSDVHKRTFEILGDDKMKSLKRFFEITTVTKKLRRIAKMDPVYMKRMVKLNRPDYIVLNFLNYVYPEVSNCKTLEDVQRLSRWSGISDYVSDIESMTGVPVSHLGLSREVTVTYHHD